MNSSSAASRKYTNSVIPILELCVLVFISITSFDGLRDYVSVFSNVFADRPQLSTGAHLQSDRVERPSRWAEHYVTHAGIEHSLVAGTFQTSTRRFEIDGTSCVRTSPAIRDVLAVARAQQHSRIIS